jgi:threonine/homoserine/homoserine lactone efflux protein
MLVDAIGGVLPFAVGVALSPIPIIAVILMLATPRARSNGPAFALGWVLGLTAASALVLWLSSGSQDSQSATADTVNWAQLAIGVLFLALAGKQWRGRPRHGEPPTMPKWVATIDEVGPPKAFGLGVLLSGVNPKNLALAAAAGAAIATAGLDGLDDTVAIAVFVVLGSVTVVGSVLAFLVAPRATAGPLDSINEFMTQHNSGIMMVLFIVLGAKLIGDGLGVLG